MAYPAKHKIGPVHQGSTFRKRLTWLVAGDPVNLTGYTARMDIRESVDSDTATLSASTSNYITLGGGAGTVDILIPASVMETVPPGRYVYDLELVSGGSPPEVTAIVAGQFIVDPEVTR